MNTKSDLISRAFKVVGNGPADQTTVDEFTAEYESLKRKYLEERDWVWSLVVAKGAQISSTSDGPDRGFKYKYKIGVPNVLDIRAVNTTASIPAWTDAASQDQLIRLGYSRGDTTTIASTATAWEYIDDILYSDSVVTNAIVKVNPDERVLPESFSWVLVYALAAIIALGELKDHNQFRAMQSQLNKVHNEALRDWNKRPPRLTLDDTLILEWLQTFYRQSRNY